MSNEITIGEVTSAVARVVRMMSSREIADLTGKDHKHVLRDIRVMVAELEKDGPVLDHQFREEEDARGYTAMCYLDRELTDTLLLGYDVRARRAVVRRWHQLETEAAQRMDADRSRRQARLEGKGVRKTLVDVIERFIAYARSQGSSNADWYYTSITTMEYKALGLVKQPGSKAFRDTLDGLTNTQLAMVETVCQHGLIAGMDQRLPYKEIFKLAQARVLHIVAAFATSLPAPVARIAQATHPPPPRRALKKVEARPAPTGRASDEESTAPTVRTSMSAPTSPQSKPEKTREQ